MNRLKLVYGFVVALSAIACSAVPAFAEFQSNSSALTGTAKAGSVLLEGGGATLECTGASGKWDLLETPEPAEKLTITTWTGCRAKSSLVKNVAASVSTCEFVLSSPKRFAIDLSVINKPCVITVKVIGTCEIKIGTSNKELIGGIGGAEGPNIRFFDEYAGITDMVSSACLGIKATQDLKENTEILLEGEKLV